MNDDSKNVTLFLVGLTAGAVLGIWLASDEELVRDIKKTVTKVKADVESTIDKGINLMGNVKNALDLVGGK